MASLKRTDRSRLLILDAAEQAFRELGLARASVEEIAARAGLTRKTVYNHFGSKEEIARQLVARAEAVDDSYRARIAEGEAALPLLRSILLDSARWCLANPVLAALALSPAERPSIEPPADRPTFQGIVRDVVRHGQSQGVVRADEDANFMALVLLGIFGQAMLNALADGRFEEGDITRIVRIVFEGIADRPTGIGSA